MREPVDYGIGGLFILFMITLGSVIVCSLVALYEPGVFGILLGSIFGGFSGFIFSGMLENFIPGYLDLIKVTKIPLNFAVILMGLSIIANIIVIIAWSILLYFISLCL
jgi:hypothetical protein